MFQVNLRNVWFVEKTNARMKNGPAVKIELRIWKKKLHIGNARRNPGISRDFIFLYSGVPSLKSDVRGLKRFPGLAAAGVLRAIPS